jgi:2,5-diamino-6-(ribosylamino)-4(3H)-pyrimidinone 5'-phosphate reductase
VVAHVAISLEGATTGFEPDIGRFYELARTWDEDVTLVGADTILAQEDALAAARGPGPAADGPVLAVVDGRGRVSAWEALRDAGHWREVVALHCAATPPRRHAMREIVAGEERVDLAAALADLGGDVVRVDSGGTLVGALLADGLLDEISLLVHPCLAGEAGDRRWHGGAPARPLELIAAEVLDGGLVWLRHRVRR